MILISISTLLSGGAFTVITFGMMINFHKIYTVSKRQKISVFFSFSLKKFSFIKKKIIFFFFKKSKFFFLIAISTIYRFVANLINSSGENNPLDSFRIANINSFEW